MRPDDDPFAPVLRLIVLLAAIILVVLWLTACATPVQTIAPAKPAFPDDMRIVCYEGVYYLGSVSADEVVRLPLSCT